MSSKILILFSASIIGCNPSPRGNEITVRQPEHGKQLENHNPYKTISDIPVPIGYSRTSFNAGSFALWLRNLSLKKNLTVYKFDGRPKFNQSAQFAVINMPVGNKDLQQCADAIMRLRAEYLYSRQQFDQIHFTDNNYKPYTFKAPYTRNNLEKYLQKVFAYCGTASLEKQMKQRLRLDEIKPGDVFIRGGFPGHAVIVVDVAENNSGKKIYMLAQSYMPAQDIHILKNPSGNSPWYEVNDDDLIVTPEYTFNKTELKRF